MIKNTSTVIECNKSRKDLSYVQCAVQAPTNVLKLGTDSNFQSHDLTTIICCVSLVILIILVIFAPLNTAYT